MIIPGFIIALFTFPGVIVHELAHQLFCRWQGVAVLDVKYFRVGIPVGYVLHEPPRTAKQTFLISGGPLILNTALGLLIAGPASVAWLNFGAASALDYLLLWLGISIAMHSFPSIQDTKNIWAVLSNKGTPLWLKLSGYPLSVLFFYGSLGAMVWLDLVYGIAICVGVPMLLVKGFPLS